jgi:hypothetical protein
MTLIIQKPTGAKLNLRKTWQPMDADAAAYITAVETADTEPLEEKTKIAIDNFVLGCKADGIWSAIKASCILAGARTLTGALVPLVGTAPTNVGGLFVSGDYNRKTGLVGDGSTKYLDSNRNNNADPQNSKHVAIFGSVIPSDPANVLIGNSGGSGVGNTVLLVSANKIFTRNNATTANDSGLMPSSGFVGTSRADASSYARRLAGTNQTVVTTSQTPANAVIGVFAGGNNATHSAARLAFYSIGESLNLTLLDARVTDLINAFGAAIP